MKNKLKLSCLNCFATLLTFLTIFTVNSACVVLLGQDKEPDSLKRFNKNL